MTQSHNVGPALDTVRLAAWLDGTLDTATHGAPITVVQFPHGFSNLTYALHIGSRDWVLRRPPVGANVKSGHDMEREYRVLSALFAIYPRVPRPIAYCADTAVLGAPFYIMERVEGLILRNPPPPGLALPPAAMAQASRALVANLVAIHALDYAHTPLVALARPGSYVERQITGWLGRYAAARTDDLPALERVGTWLAANMPPDTGAALIHNDYKYDNLVYAADLSRIVAVLDWEMATIGDPLMDVGTTLAYWVAPHDPPELLAGQSALTVLPGNYSRAELAHAYALQSGRDLGHIVFYYVYGLYKLAVIAQQIYARYRQGHTADVRFGQLLPVIRALGESAAQAITRNSID